MVNWLTGCCERRAPAPVVVTADGKTFCPVSGQTNDTGACPFAKPPPEPSIWNCGRRSKPVSPAVLMAEKAAKDEKKKPLLSAADMDTPEGMDDPDVYMDAPPAKKDSAKKAEAKPAPAAAEKENKAPEKEKKWAQGSKLAEKDGEVAMLRGNTFLLREDFEEAEGAFDKAIELQPSLEEAHIGKVNALRGQRRFLQAFKTCREGLAKIKSEELERLREVVQGEYQANKRKVAEDKKKAMKKVEKQVTERFEREMAACPSSGLGHLKDITKSTSRDATDEEREEWKNDMLNVFRDMYSKTTSAEAVNQSVASYTNDSKLGLQIEGGHRHMPRPKDVVLPADYKKPVGHISLQKLAQYNCEGERLLISVYGDVFDVSDRPDKYGKDGPYYYFSGADITYGLASGKDDLANVNKFYDLWKLPTAEARDQKLQCLCAWIGFYEKEYGFPVGRLEVYDSERNLPPPPQDDGCAVM